MKYKDAVKEINAIGKIASENQLTQIEMRAKKIRDAYTATTKKIQNSIVNYGTLPNQKITTLFNDIDKQINKLSKQLQREMKSSVNSAAKVGIMDGKRQSKPLAGFLKFGAKTGMTANTFGRLWHDATNKLLTGIDGVKLSDRVWDTNRVALKDIKKKIALGLVEGKYPSEIANEIRGFLIIPDSDMRTKYWKQFYKDNPPGRGVYKSAAKNLDRLHRTEMGRAYRMGTAEYAENKSWSNGLQWHRVTGYQDCVSGECDAYEVHDEGLGEGVFPVNSVPVSHPNCYSKDTRVLTDHGFRYFYEVEKTDKIMSLDPKTLKMEFVKWNTAIEYKYSGDMIEYKHRGVDLLVTPNHRMLIRKNWKNKLYIKSAESLLTEKEYRFLRTGKWKSVNSDKIDIWLARFYGWYLSEGSVCKRGSDWYQLAIAQQKPEGRERIKEILSHLNIKYREDAQQIGFNGKFAKQIYEMGFGKSYEKFVPEFIKNADIKSIKAFLEEYCRGDGYERDTKIFGYNSEEVSYFTSSIRIKDDICELLLKVGKSFYANIWIPKGTTQTHRNGTYTTNHDVYSIRESKSNHIRIRDKHISKKTYDDNVYCLELEKNGVMFVERNGYGLWCGNCQCYVTVHPSEQKTTLEQDDGFVPASSRSEAFSRMSENIGSFGNTMVDGNDALSLAQLNSQLRAVERIGKKYNYKIENMSYAGSSNAPVGVYSWYPDDIAKGWLEFNKELFSETEWVVRKAQESLKQALSEARTILQKNIQKAKAGVARGDEFASDYLASYRKRLDHLPKIERWWNNGDDIIHGCTTHESYHAVYYQNRLEKAWTAEIGKFEGLTGSGMWDEVSKYGSKNLGELFAETGNAIDNGINIPQGFVDAFKKVIKAAEK